MEWFCLYCQDWTEDDYDEHVAYYHPDEYAEENGELDFDLAIATIDTWLWHETYDLVVDPPLEGEPDDDWDADFFFGIPLELP